MRSTWARSIRRFPARLSEIRSCARIGSVGSQAGTAEGTARDHDHRPRRAAQRKLMRATRSLRGVALRIPHTGSFVLNDPATGGSCSLSLRSALPISPVVDRAGLRSFYNYSLDPGPPDSQVP